MVTFYGNKNLSSIPVRSKFSANFEKKCHYAAINFFVCVCVCVYVPGFQRQVFNHVKIVVGTIKEIETKKEEQRERLCRGI